MDKEKPLTIGRIAKMTGLSPKSIRYYEEEKLIPRAVRSPSGYRLYTPKIVERLIFIQKAKVVGFSLSDIRRLLDLTDRGKPCCDKVYEWSELRLRDLDEQIRFLSHLRTQLIQYREEWGISRSTSVNSKNGICALIDKIQISKVRT